jgi:GT2 family glycosyltransferase
MKKKIQKKYQIIFLILNYKTYNDTIKLAKELISYKSFGSRCGIVIVDNASPNESWNNLNNEFAQNSDVYLVRSELNGGYARGNNVGLKYMENCPPKYVCIINNDVHFTEKTIDNLINIYPLLPNAVVISPVQKFPDDTSPIDFNKINNLWQDILRYFPAQRLFKRKGLGYKQNCNIPNVEKVDIIEGAFMFVDYEKFKTIGFYDNDTFLFCEERIVARRVINAGYHNYYILHENYLHEHSNTINKEANSIRQLKLLHESTKVYYRNYCSFSELRCLILNIFYYSLAPLRLIARKFTSY